MSILSSLIGPVTEIIGKFVPDKDKAGQLAHDISTMADKHAQEAMLAQIEVNKAEAQGNWFQASWRPLCGYVCVLGSSRELPNFSNRGWLWVCNPAGRDGNHDAHFDGDAWLSRYEKF
jgi:hypothetical protein